MVNRNVILMSIKPDYSKRIFEGTKRYELRRQRINAKAGDVVLVYASAPTQALVGVFFIADVSSMSVDEMWIERQDELGISHADYRSYFEGIDTAHALEIEHTLTIPHIPLSELQRKYENFRPPQSFMYWTETMETLLPPCVLMRLRQAATNGARETVGLRRANGLECA